MCGRRTLTESDAKGAPGTDKIAHCEVSAVNDEAALLNLLERELNRFGRESVISRLRPGLDPDDVRERVEKAGLKSSPYFEALYAWRDGVDTTEATIGEIDLIPGCYLLSLDDALTNYRAFRGSSRWNRHWLPFLADGGGDFYVVEASSEAEGAVRHFRIDESEHPVEFSSVSSMIVVVLAAYRRGAYFLDENGYLEMHDELFADLARELDPGVPWWH
jgi:hypothetical protein